MARKRTGFLAGIRSVFMDRDDDLSSRSHRLMNRCRAYTKRLSNRSLPDLSNQIW